MKCMKCNSKNVKEQGFEKKDDVKNPADWRDEYKFIFWVCQDCGLIFSYKGDNEDE